MRRRDTILEALELLREHEPAIGLTQILAFLYVCENEGLSVQELAFACGFTEATASRAIRSLAEPGAPGALPPRTGWIQTSPNPQDGRGRMIGLTAEGRRMVRLLDEVISAARPIALRPGADSSRARRAAAAA